MDSVQTLEEAMGRVQPLVHQAVEGLSAEQLNHRIDPQANTIAWLAWHIGRVQDAQVADVAGLEQVWTSQGWADRFALSLDDAETGYGHTADKVAAVRVASPELLTGYYDATWEQSRRYLRTLDDRALDRVVDQSWDPPVTLGVRLISVVGDDLEHVGQAAFLRGVVQRSTRA